MFPEITYSLSILSGDSVSASMALINWLSGLLREAGG
jgi:hypothetical protein